MKQAIELVDNDIIIIITVAFHYLLEMKNRISELKHRMDDITNRVCTAGEKINKLKNVIPEMANRTSKSCAPSDSLLYK